MRVCFALRFAHCVSHVKRILCRVVSSFQGTLKLLSIKQYFIFRHYPVNFVFTQHSFVSFVLCGPYFESQYKKTQAVFATILQFRSI